ncbi:N-acetylglucosaminidase [Aquibacillus sp. 3ASR75-11]|uniref:N-acetylglucosaminidase n=1 Tax=Terrihalobacillus insolitus TaxID=2950438 RepID=A0A9X3WNZ8_9BACI|nr:N-acetylglucosaminidase [Terrihalobacillus insolitus]MDC3423507.1 N-acetylglucosaminidase [Terrihalobacillus insolitus]
MTRIRQKSFRLFMVALMIFSILPAPMYVMAETADNQVDSKPVLYQTSKEITVDGNIVIQPDTYLYGVEKQETPGKVYVQFGKEKIELNKENLINVEVTEETPQYQEYNDGENMDVTVDVNQGLYAKQPDDATRITFQQTTTYPVVQDAQGNNVFNIGNVAFYLQENSAELSGDDNNTSSEDSQKTDIPNDAKKEEESSVPTEEEQVSTPKKEEDTTEVNEKEAIIETQAVSNPWKTSTSKYFQVNEENLAVYDNSTGSNVEVGQLKKGQVYPRISSYGPNWHKIQYGNIEGFVYAPATSPVNGSQLKNENTTYSNQSKTFKALADAVVYDNTSGDLVDFGVIEKGENYPIVSDYGNWWRVILSDRVGYVNKDSAKLNFSPSDDYFQVTSDYVAVYDNRSGDLVKVGELTKGQVYPRISSYGPSWQKIQFGNIYGYVNADNTKIASGNNLRNENTGYSNQARTFTPNYNVPVYDNSSGELVQFGQLKAGRAYPIASDYGNWWRVIFSDRVGYVSKDTVRNNFVPGDKYFRVLRENLPIYDNRSGKLVEVAQLTKGQVYPRISSYGSNWQKIQYGNISGYVYANDTESANGSSLENVRSNFNTQERSIIPINDVPVYDNSSGKLVQFATLKQGKAYPKVADYGNWWRVVIAGREGYVQKEDVRQSFLPGDKYFRVVKDGLPVYDNRGGSLNQVGELRKGQTYPIVSNYGNWWRIQFGEYYGYVNKSDTEYGVKSSIRNLNGAYENSDKIKVVANKNAEIFDNSSGKLIPFGELEEGTIYPIAFDYGNWWGVIYGGRIGYISKNSADRYGITETDYDLTLDEAINIQMKSTPQTDKYRNEPAYVSSSTVEVYDGGYINTSDVNLRTSTDLNSKSNIYATVGYGKQIVILDDSVQGDEFSGSTNWFKIGIENDSKVLYVHSSLAKKTGSRVAKAVKTTNVFSKMSLNSNVYGTEKTGEFLTVLDEGSNWHRVDYGSWRNPTSSDVSYYMNPANFVNDEKQRFQFLDLSYTDNVTLEAALRTLLSGQGVLDGKEKVFMDAGIEFGVNPIYLISHALLETAKGTSQLAKGIEKNGTKVYNMYGIGANDNCAIKCGTQRAYDEEWFSVDAAIIGGAGFIGKGYIQSGQNTLYKMRWDPEQMVKGSPDHQYATDIGWAYKQVNNIYNTYQKIEWITPAFNIPVYK